MRTKVATNQVDAYLGTLSVDKQMLGREIRRIIQKTVGHLEETYRWNNPCYFFYGPVCYFTSSRNGLHFGFFRGKELSDPHKRLVSRSGQYPHIKIRCMDDIDEFYFASLLREAVTLNQN